MLGWMRCQILQFVKDDTKDAAAGQRTAPVYRPRSVSFPGLGLPLRVGEAEGRTYPARDRAWRGGTSGLPSPLPGPRCPRPPVGGPTRSAPSLTSAVARSAHLAPWPQPAPNWSVGG